MSREPRITFGDNVRIRATPETEATGMAGIIGNVHGETTPSVSGVQVIGGLQEDWALHVFVEALGRGAWFAPHLLEFVNHGEGTTITLDGLSKQWVRQADGAWEELPRSLPSREWFGWIRGVWRRLRR